MLMPRLIQRRAVLPVLPVLVAWLATAGVLVAEDRLVVLPGEFTLEGPEARQRLLVGLTAGGRFTGSIADGLVISSSDESVVRLEGRVAVPVGDGTAVITAVAGKLSAKATVNVHAIAKPVRWDFRIHVRSVLSKSGCNSGACHGALAGKNGFKLSLRGYDPVADVFVITRQARGRRIVPDDPGRSLLLLKPTATVPHKGGRRFAVGSLEYRVLSEWIAAGAAPPAADGPRLDRLEMLPATSQLVPGASQQLVVRAHFSDGHAEDVTRWVKYTSNNTSVADVDGAGLVTVTAHGESAVVAWYLSRNVVAEVSVPFATKVDDRLFADAPRLNQIDSLVLDKLQRLRLPPSPPTSDAEFLRRACLDTIGVLPDPGEVRAFLADSSPDKRERLVDRLLARPEFVDYWSYKWSDLLLVNGARLKPAAVKAYYGWIRERVEANVPWDRLARDLVTARGSTLENGAANFYVLHEDPLDMAETVSMVFLGMSIQCAKCHDHPLEKWTNDDYYGMANLFSRVRAKERPQPPRPLDGVAIPFDRPGDRRMHLASWLTDRANPYFRRAIVNRVWANFFGVGIVEKVDDLRLTNPPSNEPLLAALADYLADNRYDLKTLMRLILTSATYQRSSRSVAGNEADTRFYARYYPRRLRAEVLERRVRVPDPVRATRAGDHVRVRAVGRAEHGAGAAHRQRRHAQWETRRERQPDRRVALGRRTRLPDHRRTVSLGAVPLPDRP